MKKNWFSLRLYLEGIRQLRLIGIMGMVILSLEAILIPVGRLVNIREMRHFTSSSITKTLLSRKCIRSSCCVSACWLR